jgi:O-antigen/teichoic acid export membrane protein
MSRNESTFRPALQLMSGRATAFAVTFLIPVVLSRIFTKSEFGTYKQIFLIVYSLYGVGQVGMAECLYYFLPNFPNSAGRYVTNSLVILGMTGLTCFAILCFAGQRIAGWLSNPALAHYAWITGAYMVFMLLGVALEIVMVARKRFRWATVTYAASDVLRGILMLTFALVTHRLGWVLFGGLLFLVIRVTAFLLYLRSEFPDDLRFDIQLLKQQFMYTVPFSFAVLIDMIQQNYHQYAVSFYFDAATFAIYSVGCLQIPLTDFLASPASNVMMVRMGEEIREGRRNHLLPIWHDTTRKLALVFIPLAAMLIVNAHRIITFLFTDQYAASVPIFMLWSLTVISSIFQTDAVLRVFAETRFLVVMNLSRLATIIALMSWAIHRFYLLGPVIVTLSGVMVARAVALARIKTILKIPVRQLMPWLNLGGICILAMLAAVPASLVSTYLRLPSIYVLPISGMIYVGVYASLLLIFGLLTEGEKGAITGVVAQCRRWLYVSAS